jgi:hypothetical protein
MNKNDLQAIVDLLDESISKLKVLQTPLLPDGLDNEKDYKEYLSTIYYAQDIRLANEIINNIEQAYSLDLTKIDRNCLIEDIRFLISEFRYKTEFKK